MSSKKLKFYFYLQNAVIWAKKLKDVESLASGGMTQQHIITHEVI